jgi:hypothetical protein
MLTSCKEHHPRDHGGHPAAYEPGDLDQRAVELDRGHRLVLLSRGLAACPASGESGRFVSVGADDGGLWYGRDSPSGEDDLGAVAGRPDDEDPPVSKDQMSRKTRPAIPTVRTSSPRPIAVDAAVRSTGTISRRT